MTSPTMLSVGLVFYVQFLHFSAYFNVLHNFFYFLSVIISLLVLLKILVRKLKPTTSFAFFLSCSFLITGSILYLYTNFLLMSLLALWITLCDFDIFSACLDIL